MESQPLTKRICTYRLIGGTSHTQTVVCNIESILKKIRLKKFKSVKNKN